MTRHRTRCQCRARAPPAGARQSCTRRSPLVAALPADMPVSVAHVSKGAIEAVDGGLLLPPMHAARI